MDKPVNMVIIRNPTLCEIPQSQVTSQAGSDGTVDAATAEEINEFLLENKVVKLLSSVLVLYY